MSQKPSLLVIGDSFNRESPLLVHLQQQLDIVFAVDGGQVIDVTSDSEPLDLILLDIVGLGDKAYETCMWLKTDEEVKEVPIIAIGEEETDVSRWLNAGAADYLRLSSPVSLVAARIKSLLELKHKTDLLKDIASLDSLTSLVNQERLDDYLDIEWRRSLREFYSLSLIKIDIDGFTAYNDHYGIGMGDDVLKRVARLLGSHCNRAADMLSRYGADEFMLLLPATELDNALFLAENMVRGVSNLAIEHQFAEHETITVSAGVATIEPSRDKRHQDLVAEVEDILYRAQQMGGNQAQGISV